MRFSCMQTTRADIKANSATKPGGNRSTATHRVRAVRVLQRGARLVLQNAAQWTIEPVHSSHGDGHANLHQREMSAELTQADAHAN